MLDRLFGVSKSLCQIYKHIKKLPVTLPEREYPKREKSEISTDNMFNMYEAIQTLYLLSK